MKKILLILTALILTLLLAVSGTAETAAVQIAANSCEYNLRGDNIAFRLEGSDTWTLMDPAGNALTTAPYEWINSESYSSWFKIESEAEDGLHRKGLMDDQGKEIVPPIYMDVERVSEHWAIGVKCVPAAEEDYDYKIISIGGDAENPFMKIDAADVYFDGALVGTLTREEYAARNDAFGAYICIRNRAGDYVFYNKNMEKSPWTAESSREYTETRVDGKSVVIHQGSGKTAFVPECDLTEDEVQCPYWFLDGAVVGLQGQEILKPEKTYDTISDFTDGYAKTYRYTDNGSEYGIIDMNGTEIGPGGYDFLGEDDLSTLAKYGATVLEKDKKYGIIDREGNVLVPFEYDTEKYREAGNMIYLKQEDDTYLVITPNGELPESYKEVQFSPYEGRLALNVRKTDGTNGVIGLDGTELIPFSENDVIMVNDMGTVAVTREEYTSYTIHTFGKTE